ncbi:MAG: alcohol dehydrogenase catalytic domain-containing protein [Rectinemataceae bacterium]|nr:alcohol dehydrogenase catalytic domain-containing protein [Rectinemataceae bacterium]
MRIPSTMKAVVLTGPDKLEVRDVPTPVPGPVDVLIAVESCALCSTDVALIAHPLPGQPPYGEFTIGHEYSGTVVALGETVDEFAVGDRVAVEAHLGCGRCRNCRLGNYTACLNYGNKTKGHRANGFTTNGGNAQYVINHINTVHKIPDHVDFDEASLVTNLGCVLYGYETLGGYIVGDTVAIIGPGPLGLVSAIAARALGAGKVILTGTRASRLTIAEQLPIDRIVNSSEEDPYEAIMKATGGIGADIVIESSGSESGMELAIKATKRMGKILLLGFPHKPILTDLETLALNNKHIFTVRGEGWANVGRAISMMDRKTVDLKPLITHRYPINRINEAFSTFVNRTDGAVKVISKPQLWEQGV